MSYLQKLRDRQKAQQQEAKTIQHKGFKIRQEQTEPKPMETAGKGISDAKPEYDPYSPQACGMIQCKDCRHWNYSQCRNDGYGSADPERWRRCKGFNN